MTRADEIKYLQQKIDEVKEDKKSEITIEGDIFIEIAEHFIHSCLPKYNEQKKQGG